LLDPKKYFFPIKEITQTPFAGKNNKRCDDGVGPAGECSYIIVEPAVSYYLEEQVNKDRVHAYDGEELETTTMIFYVDPPIQ
jgi:hypothetical protein